MSNLPSGMGAFSPGGYQTPAGARAPLGELVAGLASSGGSAQRLRPNGYQPFNAIGPAAPPSGIGGGFNPIAVWDLMNLGLGQLVPPSAGSGPIGAPISVPAGPAVSGALARAPLPRSGGKGVIG